MRRGAADGERSDNVAARSRPPATNYRRRRISSALVAVVGSGAVSLCGMAILSGAASSVWFALARFTASGKQAWLWDWVLARHEGKRSRGRTLKGRGVLFGFMPALCMCGRTG